MRIKIEKNYSEENMDGRKQMKNKREGRGRMCIEKREENVDKKGKHGNEKRSNGDNGKEHDHSERKKRIR